MGRKIDMKKIEDITKCQVTFSKRRSSLMKKAHEIAVCCEVDIAFVAFSPSSRVSKFCSQKRIEDVLYRYVNLPADRRLNHIRNVQEKLEKLRQLDHIKGDASKLQFLDKQIENLELQIKKSTLELQILEADLRDYEPGPEQEPSLHQLSWCERNLESSLQKVMARKNSLGSTSSVQWQPNSQIDRLELEKQGGEQIPYNFSVNELTPTGSNPTAAGQLLMQLDPWISPYNAKVRESIFQDILGQAKKGSDVNQATGIFDSNMPNTPIIGSQLMSQSEVMSIPEPLNPLNNINLKGKNIENDASFGGKEPYLPYILGQQEDVPISMYQLDSNALKDKFSENSLNSIPELSRFPRANPKRLLFPTSSSAGKRLQVSRSKYNNTELGLEHVNPMAAHLTSSKLTSISQANISSSDNININDIENNNNYDENSNNKLKDARIEFQSPALSQANLAGEVPESLLSNLPTEDVLGDNTPWAARIQKSCLWEWDDLILNDNLDMEDFDN